MNLAQTFSQTIQSVMWSILALRVILHFIFAAAVAKDAGRLSKERRSTWLVSGVTWAFATLLGGVWVAAIYWFIHYANGVRSLAPSSS
jgi:hypothetical protein